ncbi:MAG: hypothetical protein EOS57_18600 [Mesorhizobium sp.]|nr:MAG: hypothetical protein EOS57_18600 [Mesorhizobium sp.]
MKRATFVAACFNNPSASKYQPAVVRVVVIFVVIDPTKRFAGAFVSLIRSDGIAVSAIRATPELSRLNIASSACTVACANEAGTDGRVFCSTATPPIFR